MERTAGSSQPKAKLPWSTKFGVGVVMSHGIQLTLGYTLLLWKEPFRDVEDGYVLVWFLIATVLLSVGVNLVVTCLPWRSPFMLFLLTMLIAGSIGLAPVWAGILR